MYTLNKTKYRQTFVCLYVEVREPTSLRRNGNGNIAAHMCHIRIYSKSLYKKMKYSVVCCLRFYFV